MKKYRIKYGLGGGFGGLDPKDWEIIEADSLGEATDIAYEGAIEEYELYEGTNGLRTVTDIMEEDGLDEAEAEDQYFEERESWLDYTAEECEDVDNTNKIQKETTVPTEMYIDFNSDDLSGGVLSTNISDFLLKVQKIK